MHARIVAAEHRQITLNAGMCASVLELDGKALENSSVFRNLRMHASDASQLCYLTMTRIREFSSRQPGSLSFASSCVETMRRPRKPAPRLRECAHSGRLRSFSQTQLRSNAPDHSSWSSDLPMRSSLSTRKRGTGSA